MLLMVSPTHPAWVKESPTESLLCTWLSKLPISQYKLLSLPPIACYLIIEGQVNSAQNIIAIIIKIYGKVDPCDCTSASCSRGWNSVVLPCVRTSCLSGSLWAAENLHCIMYSSGGVTIYNANFSKQFSKAWTIPLPCQAVLTVSVCRNCFCRPHDHRRDSNIHSQIMYLWCSTSQMYCK